MTKLPGVLLSIYLQSISAFMFAGLTLSEITTHRTLPAHAPPPTKKKRKIKIKKKPFLKKRRLSTSNFSRFVSFNLLKYVGLIPVLESSSSWKYKPQWDPNSWSAETRWWDCNRRHCSFGGRSTEQRGSSTATGWQGSLSVFIYTYLCMCLLALLEVVYFYSRFQIICNH